MNGPFLSLCKQYSRVWHLSQSYFENRGFLYASTPVLAPCSGEKYNDTIEINVNGCRAALADSPQLYKMMLVMNGVDRYYQFAHCFRPITEEENNVRLTEFTQIDAEWNDKSLERLCSLALDFVAEIAEAFGLSPTIHIINGMDCRRMYGNEMKPNLAARKGELSIVLIRYMPLTEACTGPSQSLTPCHHIFALPCRPEKIHPGMAESEMLQMTTESFDIVVNGIEIGGGDIRISDAQLQRVMMDSFGVKSKRYTDYLELLTQKGNRLGGGFAIGLERLMMVLTGADCLCDAAIFPDYFKNGVW